MIVLDSKEIFFLHFCPRQMLHYRVNIVKKATKRKKRIKSRSRSYFPRSFLSSVLLGSLYPDSRVHPRPGRKKRRHVRPVFRRIFMTLWAMPPIKRTDDRTTIYRRLSLLSWTEWQLPLWKRFHSGGGSYSDCRVISTSRCQPWNLRTDRSLKLKMARFSIAWIVKKEIVGLIRMDVMA